MVYIVHITLHIIYTYLFLVEYNILNIFVFFFGLFLQAKNVISTT